MLIPWALVRAALWITYALSGVGMPGCYLLQSNDVIGLPITPVTASTFQFAVPIPSSLPLLAQYFYLQAYAFAPGANAAQVILSNGIQWAVGDH